MKNAVISFFLIVILIFGAVIVNTAETKTTRENELDSNLDSAMRSSMKALMTDEDYQTGKSGPDEFIADFIQNFFVNTTSDAKFKIDIKAVDIDKGLLDAEVTGYYNQVIGTGKVSSRKTVVLEDYDNMDNVYYTMTFNDGDTIIKQINVHIGDSLKGEMLPQSDKYKGGWTLEGKELIYTADNIDQIKMESPIVLNAVK